MDVLDYIPTGSSHAVSRRDLCNLTGLSDRRMRKAIHDARRTTPILNLSDGDGYFTEAFCGSGRVQAEEHRLVAEVGESCSPEL